MIDLSKYDWAYLAGILDGEGCIGVYSRSKQHKGNRQITPARSFRPRISVTSTTHNLVDWLQTSFGGQVEPIQSNNENWKDSYHWDLVDVQTIFAICKNTLPYLKVKKEQAELVLEFPFNVKCNQYTTELTQTTYALKESLYQRTLKLNKRGK